MIHLTFMRRRVRKSNRVQKTAWCGYQAQVGQYRYEHYRGPNDVPLVRHIYQAYTPQFMPSLMPKEWFVDQGCSALANCPTCKAAYARLQPVSPKEFIKTKKVG